MDTASLATVSTGFGIVAPLLIGAVYVWVVWRTESLHFVRRRLWRLVHGNQDISDARVREFVDEQTSLNTFRWLAGIPVASLDEAHQLLQWTKLNGVQMRTLRFCGAYFDATARQVKAHKLPSRFWERVRLAGFVITVAVGATSAGLAISSPLLLSLKATHRSFWASATEARTLWPLGQPALTLSACAASADANAARTGFTAQEVETLCGVLKQEGFANYVKEALGTQRWALAWVAGVLAWAAWICLAAWASVAAARSLAQRRLDPSIAGTQLGFDWL